MSRTRRDPPADAPGASSRIDATVLEPPAPLLPTCTPRT